jgi:hypothetical protein
MALTDAYTVAVGRIADLFSKIQDGQAPDVFTSQLLKDWGFTSSNDRAALPLLKELGFLSGEGRPTIRYHEYRNHSMSKLVMAQAIREAYADLFLIKAQPSKADKDAIEGKFKSYHNVSDNVAGLMAKTFFALLDLADLNATNATAIHAKGDESKDREEPRYQAKKRSSEFAGLHYNFQIHLPATKDVEVYNAIFKSIKEHLVDE